MNSLGLFWQETFENKHESLKTAFFDLGQKINWELFKPFLDKGLGRLERDLKRGGRPNFDPTKMFKILILQANLQDFWTGIGFPIPRRFGFFGTRWRRPK